MFAIVSLYSRERVCVHNVLACILCESVYLTFIVALCWNSHVFSLLHIFLFAPLIFFSFLSLSLPPSLPPSSPLAGVREVVVCKDGSGKVGISFFAESKGVFVCYVKTGSPGAMAGLRFGDQILQVCKILEAAKFFTVFCIQRPGLPNLARLASYFYCQFCSLSVCVHM